MGEDVRKAVEKLNLGFGEGFRRGDALAVAALYTDDAVLLPPNSKIIHGRQGIEKYWRKAIQNGLKDVVMTTAELSVNGDTFHVIGDYTAKISDKGQSCMKKKENTSSSENAPPQAGRHTETFGTAVNHHKNELCRKNGQPQRPECLRRKSASRVLMRLPICPTSWDHPCQELLAIRYEAIITSFSQT